MRGRQGHPSSSLPSNSQRSEELRPRGWVALRLVLVPTAAIASRLGLPEQLKCKPNQHGNKSHKVSDPAERPQALTPKAPLAMMVMACHQNILEIIESGCLARVI
jgi:hypothetical protein